MATATRSKSKKTKSKHVGKALNALLLKEVKDLPPSAFVGLPEDGASNHDHYLYGTRKKR